MFETSNKREDLPLNIGSHLVTGLIDNGSLVRLFDNFSRDLPWNVSHLVGAIDISEGERRDFASAANATSAGRVATHRQSLSVRDGRVLSLAMGYPPRISNDDTSAARFGSAHSL
jgi:nucleoside-diphosphate-sugar epimerase